MADFYVGDIVKAKKFGSLEHDFTGEVAKVYEHSLLLDITEYDPQDKVTVGDMNQRAVVRQTDAKVIKAGPRPEPTPDEDDQT